MLSSVFFFRVCLIFLVIFQNAFLSKSSYKFWSMEMFSELSNKQSNRIAHGSTISERHTYISSKGEKKTHNIISLSKLIETRFLRECGGYIRANARAHSSSRSCCMWNRWLTWTCLDYAKCAHVHFSVLNTVRLSSGVWVHINIYLLIFFSFSL